MKLYKVEVVKKKGQWHFRLKARNGKIICSSERYKRKSDCWNAVGLAIDILAYGERVEVVEK